MPTVKTAISVEQELFTQVEELATYMKLSRSRVFTLAMRDFLQRQKNQLLLEQLNEAYSDKPDSEDEKWLSHARQSFRRLVEGEW